MNAPAKELVPIPLVSGQATSLLQAITSAASNPQTDIEKMERLFKMHQEMVKQDAEAAFNAAMARAQAKIVPVTNNASNSQTNSRYAKLAAINKVITPIYTAEGLSISFDTGAATRPEEQRTIAIVSHAAGHNRQFHLDLPMDDSGAKGTVNKTKVHATASSNHYARRYLVCMIFNVTTEDDDDGNAAGGRVMDEATRLDFETAIDSAVDAHGLEVIWKQAVAACHKTPKDMDSYNALKKLVADKGAALKGKK